MLLIPGLGHTAYVYNAVAPEFTSKYHVVAVTRRDHGLSEKIGQAPDLDQLVDDLDQDENDRIVWYLPYSGPGWTQYVESYRGWSETEFTGISVPVLSIQTSQEEFIRLNLEGRGESPDVVEAQIQRNREQDAVLKKRGREMLSRQVSHAVIMEVEPRPVGRTHSICARD